MVNANYAVWKDYVAHLSTPVSFTQRQLTVKSAHGRLTLEMTSLSLSGIICSITIFRLAQLLFSHLLDMTLLQYAANGTKLQCLPHR